MFHTFFVKPSEVCGQLIVVAAHSEGISASYFVLDSVSNIEIKQTES